MKFINFKYLLFFFGFFFSIFSSSTFADETKIPLEFFGRDTCKHCQDEKAFLESIKEEFPEMEVKYYDIETESGKELFHKVTEKAKLSKTTPLTFVGNTFIQGFGSDATTGLRITELLKASLLQKTLSIDQYLASDENFALESVAGGTCAEDASEDGADCEVSDTEFLVEVPFLGPVNLKSWSLPTMSLVLGLIDGFNPCAMWVLIMFLMVLTQAGSRTRMFQIAGIFILAEAIMYYLILNVWMTTWDFVGLDQWVTPIIGLVAIGGGMFFLYEAYTFDGTCKVASIEQRKKISERINEYAHNPMTWMVFFGIIGLAFSVNIIEFACSIGIPQAFTKVLDINLLTWIEKQWYMFLYIIMYMFDDFIVFGVAFYSFEKLGAMNKYAKYSNFIGGILMLIIGGLMILKPELLVF
jgi:cytochrome c biogenesis protein CcdA/glutaredoxin